MANNSFRRGPGQKATALTFDECRRLLAEVRRATRPSAMDHALMTSILLCGAKARTWTWGAALENPVSLPFEAYRALRDYAMDKKLSVVPFNHAGFSEAHWAGGAAADRPVFTAQAPNKGERGKAITTHEATRRLKKYARRCGIDPAKVSLRTLANAHRELMRLFCDADELGEALGIAPITTLSTALSPALTLTLSRGERASRKDPRLHGIGRRTLIYPA